MATATADRLQDTAAGDEYGQALGEGEITRLLKTVQAAQFKKSETFVAEDTAFKPRSLVEIAFAAEQKRQQEEQAALAAQQAAAAEAASATDLAASPADLPSSEGQGPDPKVQQQVPEQAPTGAPESVSDPLPDNAPDQAQANAQQAEEEARRQREVDDEALRQAAEEQGYKRGFEAGLDAARTAEPTAEELALQAEKEHEKQAIVAKFHAAIAALASPQALDSTALIQAINEAVRQLAAERAGQIIVENPEGFMHRIRQLVDRVSSAAQKIDVFVNPADLEVLNTWMQDHTTPSGWRFAADAQLSHGDIRLLLGGIEITDILHPVAETPDAVSPALADDAVQLTAEPAAGPAPEPKAELAAEPVAELAPETTSEAAPEEMSGENSAQSPEHDSE